MTLRNGGSGLSKYKRTMPMGIDSHFRICNSLGLALEKINARAKAVLTKKWK
jgi:hypothetical protein